MYKIVIFGFGGRCVELLLNLYDAVVNTEMNIIIVAIYDSFYNEVIAKLSQEKMAKIKYFMKNTKIYSENINEENIYLENDFDVSFITSQNYKHYHSLLLALKYNKNIYCEKPIVKDLDDLLDIEQKFRGNKKFFQIGLTLRYTKMVDIVLPHLHKIGRLVRVYGKEFINIGHGVHIMVGWRRYKYLSGGLGLEKVVHDYDLLLYFMEKVFHIPITNVKISGIAKKTFWTKENEKQILENINQNEDLFKCYHRWSTRIHQTLVDSPFENLDHYGIVPDYQKINMYFEDCDINLDFELDIGGYRTKTERCYEFYGTNGKIIIDVINSKMQVLLKNEEYDIDLQGDGSSHSGGDRYNVQIFIELLKGNICPNIPSFEEAVRSTHIGILCEKAIEENKIYEFKLHNQ